MEAYFDNSATTKVLPEVIDVVVTTMQKDYGNPSSLHKKGIEAERYVRQAREVIAKTLKVSDKEILFTSGGTESNNTALIGTAIAARGRKKHIIISAVEHAAVSEPAKFLESRGFEVTVLPVDEYGIIDKSVLFDAIREDTLLVSVMYVNNEIGTVEPVAEIAEIVHKKNPETYFHVDAIQAYGKYRIYPKKLGIDLLSVSGHKIHAPKGTGFLYIRDGVKISPIIYGGGQQKGMRSGTDNVPGIAGLSKACEIAYRDFEKNQEHMYSLREAFIKGVSEIDGISVNGMTDRSFAPHIVSITVSGVRAEVLLHSLEDKEIYVSAGSACSSNKPAPSKTLTNIHAGKNVIESTIRISFSEENTMEQVSYVLDTLKQIVPMLQKYVRK